MMGPGLGWHQVPSKPLSDWDSFDAQRFFLYLASSTGAAEFVRAAHAVVKQGIDGQALLKASSGLQLSRAAHQELLVELHMCTQRFPLHKPALRSGAGQDRVEGLPFFTMKIMVL